MNEGQESRNPQSPRDQAIGWFLHLQSGEATARDLQQHEAWLSQDSVHRQEFEDVSNMWKDFDQITPLITKKYSRPKTQEMTTGGASISSRSLMALLWLKPVAVALTVVTVAFVWTSWWWPYSPVLEKSYQTIKGEQRMINLADGSTILMNTDSRLALRMSDAARIVKFQQGEALFTVAHDHRRSFEVHAGNGIIHDIGTQFLVRHSSENVNVAVLEGIVEVGLKEGTDVRSTQKPKILRQGDQVLYHASGLMSSIHSFDRDMVLVWTDAQLYFDAKPLKEVIDEWARYREGEIRLQDPRLGRIPVSGKFRIDQIESFFRALEETLSIRARQITPQLIILERKAHT